MKCFYNFVVPRIAIKGHVVRNMNLQIRVWDWLLVQRRTLSRCEEPDLLGLHVCRYCDLVYAAK